ncbi:hypothetical protein M438DRAFT_374870 [Aureobasidium pullulans EXF-150]|uniref:Phytochrome chromophore attachment site domain-containing protein n=1 Tax=Aureobasidium pullulans EXF-150 TaxID=1043002 RepID=A0A074XPG1_AURPU|nr:uncharacterized protein M438DRAFT_374870 [Aureobasidium pullulans EXF-150]KEQ83862.1 hypothetical protein M438DRAFT_374870 [Aureobasidium pullulans EXF-150]
MQARCHSRGANLQGSKLGTPRSQNITTSTARMSLTQSRVFPVSSLVHINSIPISIWRRRSDDTTPAPLSPTEAHKQPSISQRDDSSRTNAIQSYGAAIGLQKTPDGSLLVSMASDNSKAILGYSPSHLFALKDFSHLLENSESDALLDHMSEAHDRAGYSNTLNVFNMSLKDSAGATNCFSCVIHADTNRPCLFVCEFIPQPILPTARPYHSQSRRLKSQGQKNTPRPSISTRSSAADTLNTMSKAQEKISYAPTIETLIQALVVSIRIATEHEDISVHRFHGQRKGRLVAKSDDEHNYRYLAHSSGPESLTLSPECKKTFETLEVQVHASHQACTASLLHRPGETFEHHLDGACYLRVLPEFSLHDVDERGLQSRVLIPLMISGKLWGVVDARSFQNQAPITFLDRGLCRLIADSVLMGSAKEPQEGLALVEYLHFRRPDENMMSVDIAADFPDLRYSPGFHSVKGFLFIPLSPDGEDFVVYFQEQKADHLGLGISGWSEADLRNAAMMRVVYCKFSSIWREREDALQKSRLSRLLLSNSSHEFRTLLNAITNYMEFAGEGKLDAKGTGLLDLARNTSQQLLLAVTKLLDCIEKGLAPTAVVE